MSSPVAYDPTLFVLERAATVTAELGDLILGVSRLGASVSAWVPVPMASFTYAEEYTPDENGTLIYGSQTATVALSYWHAPATAPLYAADRIRASYDGEEIFLGTVDSTVFVYATDPEAINYSATHRVDFVARLVGTYASALSKVVCYTYLPEEPAIDRIRRWVTVDGWPD